MEGWGRVKHIEHDRVSIESANGSKVMILSGRTGVILLPPGQAVATLPVPISAIATADEGLVEEIRRLIDLGTAVGNDLNISVAPLLDLPPLAKIVEVNHQPLSEDDSSIKQIHQAFAQGIMVRLSIEGGGGLEAIYLGPPTEEEPAQ